MPEKPKDETKGATATPAGPVTDAGEITDDDLKSVSGGVGQPPVVKKFHGSDFNAAKGSQD